MGAAVAITRLDMAASDLRAAASRERDGCAARRMLALALVLDGSDRKTAAETCGMDRQTLRDWVHRYNVEGVRGLHDRKTPGPMPKLSARTTGRTGRAGRGWPRSGSSRGGALAAGGSARRAGTALWRRVARTLGRQGSGEARLPSALRAPASSAEPNEEAQEAFKKTSPPSRGTAPRTMPKPSPSKSGSRTRHASASKAR